MSNKIQMPKPLTPEEKKRQAMRLVAQKYESFFMGAVFNMLQNPAFDPASADECRKLVANAKTVADTMMEALYKPEEQDPQE